MKKIKLLYVLALTCCILNTACSGNDNQPTASTTDIEDSFTSQDTSELENVQTEQPRTVTKIVAEYDGKTTAGTRLNKNNSGLTVTATYDDGSEEEIFDYNIKQPALLKAGKTGKIKITYGGAQCSLKVKCTTLTKKQYKNKCKTISYKKLARNPDKYEGKKIKFTGQIIQVMESSWGTAYRIDVTKGSYGIWDDTVYVEFDPSSNNRFLEDDIVSFYGKYDGLYTYETVLGASVTVPKVVAKYMDLSK